MFLLFQRKMKSHPENQSGVWCQHPTQVLVPTRSPGGPCLSLPPTANTSELWRGGSGVTSGDKASWPRAVSRQSCPRHGKRLFDELHQAQGSWQAEQPIAVIKSVFKGEWSLFFLSCGLFKPARHKGKTPRLVEDEGNIIFSHHRQPRHSERLLLHLPALGTFTSDFPVPWVQSWDVPGRRRRGLTAAEREVPELEGICQSSPGSHPAGAGLVLCCNSPVLYQVKF